MDAIFTFCMNMAAWQWLSMGVASLSFEIGWYFKLFCSQSYIYGTTSFSRQQVSRPSLSRLDYPDLLLSRQQVKNCNFPDLKCLVWVLQQLLNARQISIVLLLISLPRLGQLFFTIFPPLFPDYRFLESANRCVQSLGRDKLKMSTRRGEEGVKLPVVRPKLFRGLFFLDSIWKLVHLWFI